MTILLTPFMSCSAKLPIYSFFVSEFFPGKGGLIMSALYLFGILMGILVAFLYRGTLFQGEPVPFVMELPNYRLPGAKNVGQLLWEKAKDFLQKAFTVIFIATIVVWFLQSFDLKLNLVEDSANSMLAMVSGLLVPLFRPLGLGDWRICTSLISGFMAKESVVATLEVLFGSSIATVLTRWQPRRYWYSVCCILPVWPPSLLSAENWWKMGHCRGTLAVFCGMGGSLPGTWYWPADGILGIR